MKIDISMLDTDLLEVLSPLFIELEEIGQPLVLGSSGSTVRKSESPSKGYFVAQIRHALKADTELEKTFEPKRELQSKL